MSASTKALLLAATASTSITAAWAQQPLGNDDDVITVTGSRIARSELESSQPILTVNTDDIQFSGDVNIIDVVNDLPALIGSLNGPRSVINGLGSGNNQNSLGSGALNLRNLGPDRTLVLVDGRRHVSGVAGTASVDVNTIPSALVEKVEVLTGGAAAVYGSDAVTGVVNFILKDDFEGFDGTAQFGFSDEGDGFNGFVSGTYGRNFDDDKGNVTVSVTFEQQDNIQARDRDFSRGDITASDLPNPARTVQSADVAAFGLDPLDLGRSIINSGECLYSSGPQTALCDRASNASPRVVAASPRFNLTSYGSIIGVDLLGLGFLGAYPGAINEDTFGLSAIGVDFSTLTAGADGVVFDLNNNGIEDCLETANGTRLQRLAGFAGCHVTRTPGEGADVFQDGLLAGPDSAFGGDGTQTGRDAFDIIPEDERFVFDLRAKYDLTPDLRFFYEAKYAYSKTTSDQSQRTGPFFDSLILGYDNPFIPQNLRDPIDTFIAENPGQTSADSVNILVGRDITDFGSQIITSKRETMRFVSGFDGEINGTPWTYSAYATYGRTESDTDLTGQLLLDRFYAAADVVADGQGNPVCRSELDPSATPPGSALSSGGPFRGFETFTPGQGACQPLNLFGVGAPSQAAIDFITTDLRRERTIEQTVISGFLSGDSSSFLTLPGGPIDIVVGAEFRLEESIFVADALESPRPDSLPESSRSALAVRSLTFPADGPVASVDGEFNVWELYGEASVPLLNNMPYAETLRLDGAYRYSDYDNLGGQNTWNVGLVYEPIVGLTLRGSFSQTVRAPNINELFSPLTAATARPVDVCTQDAITDPNSNRAINCAADGLPTDFADPNTARISGFQGGNPDLEAEKADTFTAGFVLTPTALPNFVLTVDYYDITIDDGIDDVGLAQVLTACYDSDPATFADNPFCTRFERDRDSTSATFLGLSNFTLVEENFASIETSGFDFSAQYQFALGDLAPRLAPYGDLLLRVVGNKVEELERFEDPVDSSIVNDLLFENGQPEWAINTDIRWAVGALTVNLQSRYLGEFLEMTPRLEIETVDTFDNAWTGEIWRHDLSATYDIKEGVRVYGGINNLAGVDPIKSETAYPFGALGRSFFFGTNVRF